MAETDAVGLVLARPARMLGLEPFFMELIAGLEETLATVGRSLLLHVVPDHESEIRAYHRWAEGNLVDAVVVVNVAVADTRIDVLRALDLPAVIVGGPDRDSGAPNVWIDNARAMRNAVEHLMNLGHKQIARVAGPATLAHTHDRTEAFTEATTRLGGIGIVVEADYTEESGARATKELLGRLVPPTAIIFDNDVMAAAGLAVAQEAGLSIPGDLSLLAWDDSTLCRLANPPISVMSLDVYQMGTRVGQCVLDVLQGHPLGEYDAPLPLLITRGTTAAPTLLGRVSQ